MKRIWILLFMLKITVIFSQNHNRQVRRISKNPYRILIYAQLTPDSIMITDSVSFFNQKICLKLSYDTINLMREFIYIPCRCIFNNNFFIKKNGNIIFNDQLLTLKKYERLKEKKRILSNININIYTYNVDDILQMSSNDNCLSINQKKEMYYYLLKQSKQKQKAQLKFNIFAGELLIGKKKQKVLVNPRFLKVYKQSRPK